MKICRCCKKEVDEAGMWRRDPANAADVVHIRCYAKLTGERVRSFHGLEGSFDQPTEARHQGESYEHWNEPLKVRFAE